MADEAFDAYSWFETQVDDPHHRPERPPHRGPGDRPEKPPHHRPDDPHHRPERPPHHPPGPPHHDHPHTNLTLYQLISESKYTTKLAKLISDYDDLVDILNGTKANYTVFAPTDKAFAKIPEHAPKPSKEQLKKLLTYHISPQYLPAREVLKAHTIPTLFAAEDLAPEPVPQRLSIHLGFRGLTVNFYSRIVAVDIFGVNGVIHGVDSLILPPPPVLKIIQLVPSEFSTLELGLTKTGLFDELDAPHKGGTLFAPSNFAFAKLGPRLNAFLFSKYGQKYLKALLKYHVVPRTTFYSDAIYSHDGSGDDAKDHPHNPLTHIDLPTLLEDKHLSVDIAHVAGFIEIKLNGFVRVTIKDGIAKDGVVQVISDVLIPPKQLPGAKVECHKKVERELSVEELKERLEPYLE
ncbi:FAS1 domain-containing protein [Myriangium duriaei CBS 260.36]|uniref:FAS1 domain-containing protein n=1 Tax=Myriangium duriaei CBS 260.36 TaxID=1168546 RepID=A0A9P4IXE4_9PEZI|nr:FAS1 domain-containing protein [Myriangium duriaei CBS 260.36]